MDQFVNWVKCSKYYKNLIFIHGERLFIIRDGEFEIPAVQMAYEAWLYNGANNEQL